MPEQKVAYYLSFRDVIRILRAFDETPFQDLQLELDGLRLRVVRDKEQPLPTQHPASGASETADAAIAEPAAAPVIAAAAPATRAQTDGEPVVAPLAGTFYRSPFPGEPPFVEVGSVVKKGDVVGILEIMKLMNHVTAPCAGVVRRICAQNAQFVEVGELLAVIDPGRSK